jgi:hypothetical protein
MLHDVEISKARAHRNVLQIAHQARADVLRHTCEKWKVHVRKAGEEAGLHREGRRSAVIHVVFD